ncbi:hypothetical protein J7E90_11000 [Streptomyces sp. ISL-111]|nr:MULTISPECIES: hypothetical protein [unclassified Streptomyces]MBT2377867.1 hypothetical protein [Streptomyces sp. ISL-111]MBT2428783.1 hypothetical protein [Streptomyces sp. ISL-112]MBT2461199.1 hypothetical protein [Streptomyces sp. ISL-63]
MGHVHGAAGVLSRDFTYVTDTAAGFLALADCDRALGESVNLGTGREIRYQV